MHQQGLPFAEAEATSAERRNMLGLALIKVRCDCQLAMFALWVFNATAGGREGELKKSYEDLAARPWGLCCSPRSARGAVDRARAEGIVRVVEHRYSNGSQCPNGYQIDWNGLRKLLGLRPAEEGATGGTSGHGGDAPCHGPALECHHTKEDTLLAFSFNSVPDRCTDPAPKSFSGYEEIPELAEARSRSIEPLPCNKLRYGIWAVLKTAHLDSTTRMVEWQRRQLSAPQPAFGNSEAELLLALAGARYALALKPGDVRKNHVAVFVHTLSKGKWQRVLPFLPEAREQLDRAVQFCGVELLHGSGWPPAALRKNQGLGTRG